METYILPLVERPDGTYRSEVPMRYLGVEATATASADADGVLTGTVWVAGQSFPARGVLGIRTATGAVMARLDIGQDAPTNLADRPVGVSVAGVAVRGGVAVAGVATGPTGEVALSLPPPQETMPLTVPAPLARDRSAADVRYAGTLNYRGTEYELVAAPDPEADRLQVTFSGGRLSSPVQATLDQAVDVSAAVITVRVPRFWAEAWNSGAR